MYNDNCMQGWHYGMQTGYIIDANISTYNISFKEPVCRSTNFAFSFDFTLLKKGRFSCFLLSFQFFLHRLNLSIPKMSRIINAWGWLHILIKSYPPYRLNTCKSNLQLAYDCRVGPKSCRRPVVSYRKRTCLNLVHWREYMIILLSWHVSIKLKCTVQIIILRLAACKSS